MTESPVLMKQPWNRWAVGSLMVAFLAAAALMVGHLSWFALFGPVGYTVLVVAPVSVAAGIVGLLPRFRQQQGRALGVTGIVLGSLVTVYAWLFVGLILVLGTFIRVFGG